MEQNDSMLLGLLTTKAVTRSRATIPPIKMNEATAFSLSAVKNPKYEQQLAIVPLKGSRLESANCLKTFI